MNHNPDEHLLDQIDKRLNSKQRAGNRLVDELADTVPVPHEAFQQALEARLLATLETTRAGEPLMTTKRVYMPIRAVQRSWLPLTLLVIVTGIGIILVGSRPSPSEVLLAQQHTTATTTPITVTSVATSQPFAVNLPVDRTIIEVPLTLLSADSLAPKVGELVDILALLPFKGAPSNIADVPATALPDGTRVIEKFVVFGAAVLDSVEPEQTMFVSVPMDEGRLLAWLVEEGITLRLQPIVNSVLPNLGDNRVISIPTENVTADEHIQAGSEVDVYSTCAFAADGTVDCSQPANVNQTIATVIIGELGDTGSLSYDSISIAVAPDVFEHLNALNSLGMRFKLVKVDPFQSTPTAIALPAGQVAIAMPLSEGEAWQLGDVVDVVTTYKFVDLDHTPDVFQQMITPEPELAPEVTQRIAARVEIIGNDKRIVTLAVSPEEATILRWALDAHLPTTLQTSSAITSDNPNQQIHTLRFPLDSLSRWTTGDIQVGDMVDVVMGFVLGTGDEINLAYKPYGSYGWGDPFTDGEITANIYVPANGKPGADAAFINRVVQGAVVTALHVNTDPVSGRMSDAVAMLELPAGTTSKRVEQLQGYIDAGIPYLVVVQR